MSAAQGPSAFEMSHRMGQGGGGGASSGDFGTFPALLGTKFEDSLLNFTGEKALHLTGLSNMEPGLLSMLCKMRGDGFLAKFFDAFLSADEAFGAGADMGGDFPMGTAGTGGDDGSSSGSSGSGSGSNRAFSGLPSMDMAGPISNVPMHMLGQLIPSPTPGMGGRGIDMGMGGGMGAGA